MRAMWRREGTEGTEGTRRIEARRWRCARNDKQSTKAARAEVWEQIAKSAQVMGVLTFTYTLGKGPNGAHLSRCDGSVVLPGLTCHTYPIQGCVG